MPTLNEVLDRLEGLLAEIDQLDEEVRRPVLELLDGLDALHRTALERLPEALGTDGVERLRTADPALAWLLDTYGIGADERAAAERALDSVRPYIHSHGGEVELLDVSGGVVHVRVAGACSGCAASAITLREGVEAALREVVPGFQRLEVAPDHGAAHPAPGPTLLQIETLSPGSISAPAPPEPALLHIQNLHPRSPVVIEQHGA